MDRVVLGLCASLAATSAVAQIESADTPSGVARVEGEAMDEGQRLLVGDRVVLDVGDYPYKWIEAQEGSLLLVGLGIGGTACPALYVWVRTDGEVRVTEPFGSCAYSQEVTRDAETVTVVMPSMDATVGELAFVYDGKGSVREVVLGQPESGLPPGTPAEAWIGHYAYELTGGADWREPLTALVGEDYGRLLELMTTGTPMEAQGDWVVGSGWSPLADGNAAIAISRTDGRLLVALVDGAEPPRLHGAPRGPLPAAIAEIMAGGPGGG